MEEKYLLDLNAVHNRPKIKINGRVFELRIQDDFGIEELAWFQVVGKELKEQGESNTPESMARLKKLLSMAVDKIVINLPEDINNALNDMQKIQIITVFSEAVMPEAIERAKKAKELNSKAAKKLTGVKSSRGSKKNTAGTPKTG
jgi:hypothetical protein